MSEHISWEIKQRVYPKIYQFSYFSLKRIKNLVLDFSKTIDIKNYKIIDIWCGNKPYYSLFNWYSEYIWTDIIEWEYVDIVCDNANLPFEDSYFDYVLCNQTLEHTKDIHWAIKEIKRVLKKDWLWFISLPFLYPEHACPWDFYRFTRFWVEEIFKDFEIIYIKNDTWYFTTIALFMNIMFTYWKISRIIFSPIFLIVNLFFWLLEFILLDIFYEKLNFKKIVLFKNAIENQYKQFTCNYIILIKKY
ncbi:MAG: Methyltransferase type 11 [uncultured bacterium (gcode 4)]|uniref:Methyltransferase type 11 n=1 Tax=uncultured bacterium (gcode 4) TaxID=1234023 RepID=K2AWP9_9BACT|nr:MAG: Methyltransferase type 11 [uncultured bacterium (gcode 4)]